MKALIIEDDKRVSEAVGEGLAANGYDCDFAADGECGYARLAADDYAVAVIDVMLPKASGLEVVRRIRRDGKETPIVILSAMGSTADRISGLNQGADDYLAKPFSIDELIARINAVRRRRLPRQDERALTCEDLALDPLARRVTRSGRTIELTRLEFDLLECLMRNRGRILSARTIMERIWDCNASMDSNLVESRISKLRKKLSEAGGRSLIATVRGLGYVFR